MTAETFLNEFFGDANLIRRSQVDASPELSDLISDLRDDLSRPVILPRRLAAGGEVHWFVLSGDDTTLRAVREDVQGFIGPTYGRWDGLRAALDDQNAVEAAVLAFAQGRALRFRTLSDEEFAECWSAIKLMRGVWRQRPARTSVRVRTGATVLNEFELALSVGDTELAEDQVVELRRRGLLGAENLRFLEIRLLAGQGRWRDIATAADLPDLARIRRPWLVTEDLLTALYRTRVGAAEAAHDVQAATHAVGGLAQALPELFTARGPLRSADVIKLFAVRNALPDRDDRGQIERLLSLPEIGEPDRAWIAAVLSAVRPPAVRKRDAREAFAAGDIDAAFSLALGELKSGARAEILIECAFELRTLDSAREALGALDALPEREVSALLHRRLLALAVESLRELASPSAADLGGIPATWNEWLRRLLEDPEWRSAEAVAVAGELEFESLDVVDPVAADELANLIVEAADSDGRQTFRDALPRIVRWLELREVDPAIARPVHVAILTVLALDSSWGDASLEVAYSATESLISGGLDEGGYVELFEQLGLFWSRMIARTHVAWLADLLELLELHPGPRDQLISFVAASVGPILPFADRADVAAVDALARSAAAIGAEELATALHERLGQRQHALQGVPLDVLQGRVVGIYTLTPQVAVRAREAIQRRFPGVQVEVDSSYVSTPALEHLARTADYLLVSIRSAKHAATDAIDRHRPRELPTLVPRGRGSTRIVEALVAAVEREAGA